MPRKLPLKDAARRGRVGGSVVQATGTTRVDVTSDCMLSIPKLSCANLVVACFRALMLRTDAFRMLTKLYPKRETALLLSAVAFADMLS